MTRALVAAVVLMGLNGASLRAATASCICVVGHPYPGGVVPLAESLADRALARDAIFEATVLQLRNPTAAWLPAGEPDEPQSVLLLVRRAWKGVEQDTITLRVGTEAPCATYVMGQTYLVLADRGADGLRAAACDDSWAISANAAREVIATLEEPQWLERSIGQRTIDAEIILPGQRPGTNADLVHLALSFDGVPAPTVEIAHHILNASNPALVELPEGFYRARLSFSSGQVVLWDLLVSCDEMLMGRCVAYRLWWS